MDYEWGKSVSCGFYELPWLCIRWKKMKKGTIHTESRIGASQKSFFGLQSAGLHRNGMSPSTAMNMAVRSTLLYGCTSININRSNLKSLDRQQSKQIRCILGLKQYQTHTTILLQAVGIPTISRL